MTFEPGEKMINQYQSNALFQSLAEKHQRQIDEIKRKREDLVRIQNELAEKRNELPRHFTEATNTRDTFATTGATMNNPSHARHMAVYGTPKANIIRMDPENPARGLMDMRPHYEQFDKLYVPPKPVVIKMRSPPPTEVKHIDDSRVDENAAIAERYQKNVMDYYKDYYDQVERAFERNRNIERERDVNRQEVKKDDSMLPFLKEQLERTREQSENNFVKLTAYLTELNRSLEEDRRRRREERQRQIEEEKERKRVTGNRVEISTQVKPERESSSTQVSLVDEARMRNIAQQAAYVVGTGAIQPSGIVSGHPVYDMNAVNAGSLSGQASGPGVQVLGSSSDGEVIVAGVPRRSDRVQLKNKGIVTHTHDNPYVQSIIAEIQQELDDIDRERRRILIKERTKSAEQQVEKMLADLALEKERLCREVVSLARVNALLQPEGGGSSSLDPESTSAVADVLQLIKDQLRRVCKIQSEANLIRHETVMTHLKTLWSHSDAHTVVEAAPQNPPKRIPAPVIPAPIPIDPPSYGLLPAMVLFYDFVCGVPNDSLTSIVLNTSIIRRTSGRSNEEIIDLLVDMGELPPAGVSHTSRQLDGVHPPGLASLPSDARGVAMVRYKHDLPQQFPADPALFALVTLGGQQTHVTSKSHGFARCLIPLVRQVDGPEQPATGRFVSQFISQSNLFSSASLYYRLVRLEDAEAELRTWPVSLARMNLYQPVSGTRATQETQEELEEDLLRQ